ncbi:ATP-binding protein [Desulfonatronovibrio magnus]|uniref:ATP-binding protein n=1 Tax=Desulfonatronovibrio magnus TaxID=698827 RepID=UPI0005EB811D|nr:ATP-binding protein [Desulfonatronovibrio magnus]
MREIVVISGKGGTGKTSLTGAFAHLAENKIICDLDVDAPDLHILLSPDMARTEDFYSGHEAVIDNSRCQMCGTCLDMCQFGAVQFDGARYFIENLRCEGCKVCVSFCPEEAIDFPERYCGQWFVSSTRFGTMVHARLFPGAENSGRLVTLLRNQAREKARQEGHDLILCDGAPGIGCPVISSLSGTNLAVIVTEPTLSGLHDLQRVAQLCSHFKIRVAVIINKFDLNSEQSREIEGYCREKGFSLVGNIPYDPQFTTAMVDKKVVTEVNTSHIAGKVSRIWDQILKLL